MLERLRNNKTIYCLLSFCLLYLVFFCLSLYVVNRNDDFGFKDAINRYGSIWGWCRFFFNNWGGRIIPQGLLVLLLQLPEIVFHILDAAMWLVMLIYIHKVFDVNNRINIYLSCIVSAIMIFAIIPVSVLSGAFFWKCANVLYLWGMATILVAIYPIVRIINDKSYKKRDIVFAFLAVIYCSGFEQSALFMSAALVVLTVAAFVQKKKVNKFIIVLTVVACILTLIFTASPGNAARSDSEVIAWLPKYGMFSIVDKLLWGINYSVGNAESQIPVVFVVLSGIVFYCYLKREDICLLFKICSFCCFLFFILRMVHQIGHNMTGNDTFLSSLFRLINVDTIEFGIPWYAILRELINVGMIAFLGISLVFIIPDKVSILVFLTFFGGFGTMAMMGFSPTIYASADRPRCIGYVLLICTIYLSGVSMLEYWEETVNSKNMIA